MYIGRYTYVYMYTCRYTDDKGQKDRTVCRYLALPYGFSLSEWVVQVVLPNEVHVLCLLVGVARHSSQ